MTVEQLFKTYDIKQTDVARALRVEQSTVSRWVSGERNPDNREQAAIAKICDLTELTVFRAFKETQEQRDGPVRLPAELMRRPKQLRWTGLK